MAQLALSAQTHALGFYRRFGFLPEGEVYEEAGLPHQVMTRRG
jgi:predicted GNAT family N-acyltransferase